MEVQELYETLTDPGPTEQFQEDTATDFVKTPPEQQKGKKRLTDATGVVKDKICPARQSVYTKCKKVGLYASVCKIKPSNDSATGKSSDRKRELLETKCLQEVVEDDMEDDELLLPLIVVDGEIPPLLGRNWLEQLKLNWPNIFHVSKADTVSDVLNHLKRVFHKGLGPIKGLRAEIKFQDDATPIFCKAHPVPYALLQKVEEEKDRMEKLGVIKKVKWSAWASPVVCVPKKDGRIRICGDLKVLVNQVLLDNPYPLPDTEDIFARLGSGTVFSKIDLSNAYQQMELSRDSQQYLTVNTYKGFYPNQRLTYGIASPPALFQSTMDQILQGMDNVRCSIDDIIIRTDPHEELASAR
ncbi:uncharacterized protein K02A2.6-like [Orbicella faveolata]|uniref:uncharacterized protein K02A2.6-like n=1 Tax=Orbicella faveolata TaxID=48498 RepID=UPI0009E511B1|nr:uncharacterized protein K02A2.6-like [Orbicella faveolata]